MKKIGSTERSLSIQKAKLEVEVLELEKVKRQAEIEAIKEELLNKRTHRWIMRVTATITGLTLLTTIFKYMGLFTGK